MHRLMTSRLRQSSWEHSSRVAVEMHSSSSVFYWTPHQSTSSAFPTNNCPLRRRNCCRCRSSARSDARSSGTRSPMSSAESVDEVDKSGRDADVDATEKCRADDVAAVHLCSSTVAAAKSDHERRILAARVDRHWQRLLHNESCALMKWTTRPRTMQRRHTAAATRSSRLLWSASSLSATCRPGMESLFRPMAQLILITDCCWIRCKSVI